MREVLRTPFTDEVRVESAPGFGVVIAYEDFETGKHARKTYDFLADNLGKESRFTQSMWKFDVLAIPNLREMAVRDVSEADIVIISSHGGRELPVSVRAWIEHWIALGVRPLALVALFDCTASQSEGVRTYLADVARRAGIEFFAQPESQALAPGNTSVLSPSYLPGETAEVLSGAVQKGIHVPRWGINE